MRISTPDRDQLLEPYRERLDNCGFTIVLPGDVVDVSVRVHVTRTIRIPARPPGRFVARGRPEPARAT